VVGSLRRSGKEMRLVDALRKGVVGGEMMRGGTFSLLQSGYTSTIVEEVFRRFKLEVRSGVLMSSELDEESE
jgi:hypothetical protein